MNTELELVRTKFEASLDLIDRVVKGAKFERERFEGAKTIANLYGKLNQTESARETTRLIAIKMKAKSKDEESALVDSIGLLPTLKQLKK